MKKTLGAAAAVLLWGCISGGEDPTAGGMLKEGDGPFGPRIVFNPLVLPIPDIPFPNDLSLRPVDFNEKGTAWNVAEDRPSKHLTATRHRLNQVEGFGPFAPVFVSFEGRLALDSVTDDTVMIVNIEPGHPREGERVPLDLGRGNFPTSTRPGGFFGMDPYRELNDLLLPPDNEAEFQGEVQRVVHYEVETNTLILRPVVPLAQGARHAVLITRGVLGWSEGAKDPAPVQSPFAYKAHGAQAPFIERALALTGLDPEVLSFGWTYTTMDVVEPMLRLRDGLYEEGPLAYVGAKLKPSLGTIRDTDIKHDADGETYPADPRDHRYILQGEFLAGIMSLVSTVTNDPKFKLSFSSVDYTVFGSFPTPRVRGDDQRLSVDLNTGEGTVGVEEVPYLITVPIETDQYKAPFPIMFYFHGTGTSRMEALAIAEAAARQGIAVFAFDEVGHGPLIPDIQWLLEQSGDVERLLPVLAPVLARLLVPDRVDEFRDLPVVEALERFQEIGLFAEMMVHGRSEDLDGNGRLDTAEAFFHADPFKQCASFQQDVSDVMWLVRMVRGLRQDAVPPKLDDPSKADYETLRPYLEAGDFNADGVLDIGGPGVQLSVGGTSLGGFHAVLAAAVEKEITVATPIVAGGGFVDIMLRSSLRDITSRLFVQVFGTVIVGCPTDAGVALTQGNDGDFCRDVEDPFGTLPKLAPGTTVRLVNEVNGEEKTVEVNEEGGFYVAVESDRGDALRVEVDVDGERVTAETTSKVDGVGLVRNTPEFRRTLAIQQNVFDTCDPINFARSLFLEPPRDHPPTNVLFLNAIGDDTVPVSTGVNLALAAGVYGQDPLRWRGRIGAMVARGVLENQNFDIDDVRADNPIEAKGLGLSPLARSSTGVSTIRYANVNGAHEYIAGNERDGFDYGKHHQHQLAIFHRCGGRVVFDAQPECMQSTECEVLDHPADIVGCEP